MAKLAKLPTRKQWSRQIWERLVCYANAQDDRGKAASQKVRYFQPLLSNCMDWIGGDKDDIAECRDMKDGTSLDDLEARYRTDIRRVLTWLSAPDQHSESAARAARFLKLHGTGIKMAIDANINFKADADEPLLTEWPDACEFVISPVCKFILDQIERHDVWGETLKDVAPIGSCERSGCDRFFMIERIGRRQFCSSRCRAADYQGKLTKEQKAARMRRYRATIDRHKPKRFPKRKSSK